MENLCGVCFTHAELFQVGGYPMQPMCLKCSETLNTKSLNMYQNLAQTTHDNEQRNSQQSAVQNIVYPHHMQHNPIHPQHTMSPHLPTIQSHRIDVRKSALLLQSTPTNLSTSHTASIHNNIANTNRINSGTDLDPANRNSQMGSANNGVPQDAIKLEQDSIVSKLEQSILQNGDSELLYGDASTCSLCSRTFTRKSQLLSHMRNHSIDRKFICSFCQKGFTQAANLRNHERIHRNERPYVCGECGKAFTQVTNLNNHRRLHTGERPFACIEANCGRAFAQVTNLNNHMKTHHKIQQFMCNQCPKKFTQVTSLNQHLLVHSGVRGFACPQCPNKAFKQQSHLTQHMKTHGVYPFKCTQCDEHFTQASQLTQHTKTHQAELKHRCNVCQSAFAQEALLRKHMQRHVDEGFISQQFACPTSACAEVFADRNALTNHVEVKHTKPEESLNNGQPPQPPPPLMQSKPTYMGQQTEPQHPQQQQQQHPALIQLKCFFDGCAQSFDNSDKLNEHLIMQHRMIYKDIESRSKMNLMFFEQFKHQMSEQYCYNSAATIMGNGGGNLPIAAAAAAAAATKSYATAPKSQAKQNNRTQQSSDDGNISDKPITTNNNYTVCGVCFNVFRNVKTLTRHMFRFHGVAQH